MRKMPEIEPFKGKNMERILNRIGAVVKLRAIRNCPIDDGALRASIDFEVRGSSVFIYATAPHAEYIEYGTGIYHTNEKGAAEPREPIRPKTAEVLAWTAKGTARPGPTDKEAWRALRQQKKAFFAKEVKGIKPHPFMRPAIHQSIPDIKKIIAGGA